MPNWKPGRVVGSHHWTDELISLYIDAEIAPFTAGQFTKLALDINGERLARPYSLVNAPGQRPLEFYFITVPHGPFSEHLSRLKHGDPIWVSAQATGFFTLKEVGDADTLWLLASGTALGAFLSILRDEEVWRRFSRIVLVHAVRTVAELTYRETLQELQQRHPDRLTLIPFVSREATEFAIQDRIPAAILDGRLARTAGRSLRPEDSQIMICGNPDMVRDTTAALEQSGFKKNRRRDPGQITVERYW